jgi:hypothetical protein
MAGRPRKTELELLVTGQWRRDRHASRHQGAAAPLGNPPRHLTPEQRRVWREVAGVAPWLTAADRQPLELHCCLMAEARADFAAMSATRIGLLSRQAARLGLGPNDRSRLLPAPEPKPHRF